MTRLPGRELALLAGSVFTPASPVSNTALFAGRAHQIEKVVDAIQQPGQHAVIYGERGVGKTSLARMVAMLLRGLPQSPLILSVNCDRTDTFQSVWDKALRDVDIQIERSAMGFNRQRQSELVRASEFVGRASTPDEVRRAMVGLGCPVVCVFDEFDRLARKAASVFTDLIKMLSDYAVSSTVVLVGVADTIDQLVRDHASIDRALVQVPMPRMQQTELAEILSNAAVQLGMKFADESQHTIVRLSRGLPHYTHLIGLHSVRGAIAAQRLAVLPPDVQKGLRIAIENAQESIKQEYHDATHSAHKDALFEEVLLACALAPTDEMGYFQPADIVRPLSDIMKQVYGIPAFARHLKEFCGPARREVLQRMGEKRRYRYRFRNPLIQPYVIMRGLTRRLISEADLSLADQHRSD